MTTARAKSLPQRIWGYLQEHGPSRPSVIGRALGVTTERAAASLSEMKKRGEVVHQEGHRWALSGQPVKLRVRPAPIRERLWLAMRRRGAFTRQELVDACEASPGTVEKLIRLLVARGLIRAAGWTNRIRDNQRLRVYQVAPDAPQRLPQLQRKRPATRKETEREGKGRKHDGG